MISRVDEVQTPLFPTWNCGCRNDPLITRSVRFDQMDKHAVHRQMFVGSSIIVVGRQRHWQPEAKVIVAE